MKYVRSITTGAVLPYNKVLARMANVQVLTPEECDAHDALHRPKAAKSKTAKPKAVKPKTVEKKVEKKVAKEPSFKVSSNKDEIDAVVAALAID